MKNHQYRIGSNKRTNDMSRVLGPSPLHFEYLPENKVYSFFLELSVV